MRERIGTVGVVGVVVLLAGIGLVAWKAPVVAAGLALVLAGTGMIAKGVAEGVMRAFGM